MRETVSSSLYIIARESRFRTNSGFFWLDNSWTTQLSGCDKSRVLLLTSMSSSLNDYNRDTGIYRDVGTGPPLSFGRYNKPYSIRGGRLRQKHVIFFLHSGAPDYKIIKDQLVI